MSGALRKPMSQEEFVSWVQTQDGRIEFDGLQPVAMTGGTRNHGAIADNIRAELKQRLRATACRPVSPDGPGVVHARQGDEPWATTVVGEGAVVPLPEIGIELPVSATYDEVTFEGASV